MDRLSKLLFSQARQVQDQLEKLLVKTDFKANPEPQALGHFESTSDLSNLDELSIGLPDSTKERVPLLFSRLSVYFEAGIVFLQTSRGWGPFAAFFEGTFFPLTAEDTKHRFYFENINLVQSLKLDPNKHKAMLDSLGFPIKAEETILIFRPHPDYIFLVSSRLADLWLNNHIEQIHQKLLLLLSDEVI